MSVARGLGDERGMQAILDLWEEIRARGEAVLMRMRGVSMWPAAPDGSLLAVTPCTSTDLRRGELVTFRRDATIVTHRVFRIERDGTVVAWGDLALWPDAPITSVDVLGRARIVERARVRLELHTCSLAARRTLASVARAWSSRSENRVRTA